MKSNLHAWLRIAAIALVAAVVNIQCSEPMERTVCDDERCYNDSEVAGIVSGNGKEFDVYYCSACWRKINDPNSREARKSREAGITFRRK